MDDPYEMISELCTELRNEGRESNDPVLTRAREMLRRHDAAIEELERNSIRSEL
jgi:hypothetical protein